MNQHESPFAGGGLVAFLAQVGRGILDRDIVYPEKLSFRGLINAAGVVVTQPPTGLNVREGYYFAMHTIAGTYENPAAVNGSLTRVLYTITDNADAKNNVFRNTGSLARLYGNAGAEPMKLRVPYVWPAGAQILVTFTVDDVANWGGVAKRVSLELEGDFVRVDFLDRYNEYMAKMGG